MFQATLDQQKKYQKTHVLSTASCFRRVLGGCRIDKSDEFDESFVFQASKTMINVVFVDGIMFQACFDRLQD